MIIHNACDYKYSSTSTNVVDFWTKPIINTNHEFLQYTDSTDRSFQKKLQRRSRNSSRLRYNHEKNIETNKNCRDNR